MTRRDFWINQGFFQASWPACVIGAANGLTWPAVVLVGAFAAWQLRAGKMHPRDPLAIGLFVFAGLVMGTLWIRTGVVEYANAGPLEGFTPGWLLLLWTALALTVNHSLSWFKERWGLFLLLATFGSPMSYRAAAAFDAVEWTASPWLVVACLGPVWALVVAMLFRQLGELDVADTSRDDHAGAVRS
ncbi:MAG: DUF2878 domain-containing protein [Candidatus Wenzhouxiangella sp. M2_3B_020]